ncbi:beta-glucosidase [Ferruginibacter lapsinanis]|uniref:GH1 family beta-glucosidase n=1 Tax=Ferruginibacter lapsinanis TaxID=563172 RepID=UPI001E5E17D4|nr:GH1 family beta-glucosidase [Ferruginibacter lapsinanis]UEG49290.1 beta-glucosidase [Ferruginibacter lapsinanis]
MTDITHNDFNKNFLWGVATAAAQIEGAHNVDGRGISIWDSFAKRQGKIQNGHTPYHACCFYYRYKDDLLLAKALGFTVFRFSISWSRIFPEGKGKANKEGVAFYHRLIDECLKLELIPFVTLYHWDLPYALEKEGGWTSVFFIQWFKHYVNFCAKEYGDKVKHWIVLNEPMGFTSLGYMLGKHAPGKTGLTNFLPAVYNATLAQAEGGNIIRSLIQKAYIGTSFSCSEIIPHTPNQKDIDAANRIDVLLNRLFIEPALGLGLPEDDFPLMEKIHFHSKSWRNKTKFQFDFDFIGIQNYFPLTIRHNSLIPYVSASEVKAKARKVPHTAMGWEINPDSFYNVIKRFSAYDPAKDILITENGACFKDILSHGVVEDAARISYYQQYLTAMHLAIKEGIPVKGYFAWTLLDNFEWAEGYNARFGLIHVDFVTQLRTIKKSGYWWRDFLTHKI